SQGRCARPMPAAGDPESPDALGALDVRCLRAGPVDARQSLQLQQVARREVRKEERGPRLAQKISEGVEVTVAAEIRNEERVALETDEARSASAMGDVGTASGPDIRSRPAGDEERVGMLYQRARLIVESRQLPRRTGHGVGAHDDAALDVLRAV